MKKKLLYVGLLLVSQITSLYAVPQACLTDKYPGVFISSQLSPKLMDKILANIARANASGIIDKRFTDSEVVDYVMQNPDKFASLPKTLVVVSDAPFNVGAKEFQESREKLAKFPLVQAKFYNCPSFGALSQVLTLHPLIGAKIDPFLATKQAFGDKDKSNKFDEFVALLEAKFGSESWIEVAVHKIKKYRDSIQESLPKPGQQWQLPNAQQWQENIRKVNGFSKEDFQSLAHENIMHMFGIPEKEYSTILSDPSLKRSVEWMGKLAFTVGLGGAASDFLNWSMYVAGIEPSACTKENLGQLLLAAREVLAGVLNQSLTFEQAQRARALLENVNDVEMDDMAVANLMYLVNGKVNLTIFGTKNVIDDLERQGFKEGTVTAVVNNVTVLPVVDQTLLNEKNALPIVQGGLQRWFLPISKS